MSLYIVLNDNRLRSLVRQPITALSKKDQGCRCIPNDSKRATAQPLCSRTPPPVQGGASECWAQSAKSTEHTNARAHCNASFKQMHLFLQQAATLYKHLATLVCAL